MGGLGHRQCSGSRAFHSRVHRIVALAALVLLVLSHAGVARAGGREQSRESFLRGVAQAHEGNYAAARDSFLQAYTLFAHPSILLNLGIARLHTTEYVAAEQDLVRFLSDDGGASQDEIASARSGLAAVREHLGTLRIRVSPGGGRARLDGQPVALVPGAFTDLRATVGSHQLTAEADGYESLEQALDITAGRTTDIEMTLAETRARRTSRGGPREAPGSSPASSSAVLGWSLLGLGVALAGAGTACGVEAISHASDYNQRGSAGFQDPDVKTTGIAFRTAADLSFLAAIASGAVGAYVLITDPARAPSRRVGTHVLLGPGFGGIAGTF